MIYLIIQVAVFLNDSYPGQHLLAVLCLEQVFGIGRGQPQDVLALRIAVRDVNQTGFDADRKRLVFYQRVLAVLLVFIQIKTVATQHSVDMLPWSHATGNTLQKNR